MTSTKFNIGFGEEKNSSRVLKPPGGGHSDIFGVREGNEIQTPNKRKNYPQSTINSCFMHEEFSKSTKINNEEKSQEDVANGTQNGAKADVIDENTEPKQVDENTEPKKVDDINEKADETDQKEAGASQRRVRVPPGGFSSGFW